MRTASHQHTVERPADSGLLFMLPLFEAAEAAEAQLPDAAVEQLERSEAAGGVFAAGRILLAGVAASRPGPPGREELGRGGIFTWDEAATTDSRAAAEAPLRGTEQRLADEGRAAAADKAEARLPGSAAERRLRLLV